MSLLIKGIDMPKNCMECPYLEAFDDEIYGRQHFCGLLGIDALAKDHSRHKKCPLSEIPTPHGRLIDSDRLLRKCQKISTQAWKMKLHADVEITMNQFIDFVKQAPTIIEAEE